MPTVKPKHGVKARDVDGIPIDKDAKAFEEKVDHKAMLNEAESRRAANNAELREKAAASIRSICAGTKKEIPEWAQERKPAAVPPQPGD